MGRQPVAAPIPGGRRGAPAGRSGVPAETEVGVRISWSESRVCSAHRRRRARVRRQRQWRRVLAERRQRVPALVVQGRHPVRTAITIGRGSGTTAGRWIAYFGDQGATTYAVDALTGELLWKRRVEAFLGAIITGAPTLADDALYVATSSGEEVIGANPKNECCKFRGSVSALNAATGEVLWKSSTIPEEPRPVRKNKEGVQLWGPSRAAVWSSPTVDLKRGAVYVTTGDSDSDLTASTSDAFVAFDLKTGKLLWSRQTTAGDAFTVDCGLPDAMRTNCPEAKGPDFDFGSSPILVELPNGRAALIAGQKSGVVHAVDPDRNGAILWQTPVGKGGALGGVQWGSAFDGRHVYVSLSDVQTEPAQAGTPGAQQTVFGMPMRLNPQAGGGLFALNPGTGQIVWKKPHPGCGERAACSPAQSAAVTAIPGVVFSGGLDGHLRAYASQGRRHHLGHRYRAGLQDSERCARQRWLPRWSRASRGGGNSLRQFGYAFLGGMPGTSCWRFRSMALVSYSDNPLRFAKRLT